MIVQAVVAAAAGILLFSKSVMYKVKSFFGLVKEEEDTYDSIDVEEQNAIMALETLPSEDIASSVLSSKNKVEVKEKSVSPFLAKASPVSYGSNLRISFDNFVDINNSKSNNAIVATSMV